MMSQYLEAGVIILVHQHRPPLQKKVFCEIFLFQGNIPLVFLCHCDLRYDGRVLPFTHQYEHCHVPLMMPAILPLNIYFLRTVLFLKSPPFFFLWKILQKGMFGEIQQQLFKIELTSVHDSSRHLASLTSLYLASRYVEKAGEKKEPVGTL